MKTNLRVFFVFSFIIISFVSCDPGVKYDKVIQNDSDFDLLIVIYPDSKSGDESFFKNDSIVISRKSVSSIFESSGLGQTFEYEDCNTYADSIVTKIIGNESLDLSIDLNDESNWIFSIIDRSFKDGGTCECRVRITNDMIN